MEHRAENGDTDREAGLAHDDCHGRCHTGLIGRRERDDCAGQLRVRERDTKPNGDHAAEDRNDRRYCAARHQRDRNGEIAGRHECKGQGEMQPPSCPADKPAAQRRQEQHRQRGRRSASPATSEDQSKAVAKNSGK